MNHPGLSGLAITSVMRKVIDKRVLKQERESSAVKDYVRGYQEVPESAEEVEAAHRVGIAALAEEPWA